MNFNVLAAAVLVVAAVFFVVFVDMFVFSRWLVRTVLATIANHPPNQHPTGHTVTSGRKRHPALFRMVLQEFHRFLRMSEGPEKPQLSPTAMSVRDTVRLLTKVGGEAVTEDMLQEDIRDGAPANPDGTINLVHYAAWLVRELAIENGS